MIMGRGTSQHACKPAGLQGAVIVTNVIKESGIILLCCCCRFAVREGSSATYSHYILVTVEKSQIAGLTLDNVPVSTSGWTDYINRYGLKEMAGKVIQISGKNCDAKL